MASSLSAAVRVDSQVSTNYEPSVSVAGDGDASVPMEPEGVTMASSISAAVYEVTISSRL